MDNKDFEAAKAILKIIVPGIDNIFGGHHSDTLAARSFLLELHKQEEDCESAYAVSLRTIQGFLGWSEKRQMIVQEVRKFGMDNIIGASLSTEAGLCCLQLQGKEQEAVAWLLLAARAIWNFAGPESQLLAKAARHVAVAYERAGNTLSSFYWWAEAVTCWLNQGMDQNALGLEPGDGYLRVYNILRPEEKNATEAVQGFERMREELPEPLESQPVNLSYMVDSRIRRWRMRQGESVSEESSQDVGNNADVIQSVQGEASGIGPTGNSYMMLGKIEDLGRRI